MKNDKKSVLLYTEWAAPLKGLPLEEKGRIFDAIISYTESGGEQPIFENPATDMAFRWIQQKLDENAKKWEETRAKRAAAGKSGGAPKGNANAQKSEPPAEKPKKEKASQKEEPQQKEPDYPEGTPENYWVSAGCDKELTPFMEEQFEQARKDGFSDDLIVAVLEEAMQHQAKQPWMYARRLLDQAKAQGTSSLAEWAKCHAKYKGNRVDRPEPSGNDFLRDAGQRRIKKKSPPGGKDPPA